MYILAALGFAFIFNMIGTINLAHGGVYMMAGYLCYYLMRWLGVSNWAGMLIAVIVMALFGILMERFVFRLFSKDFSRVVMVGVALMTVFSTTSTVLAGTKILKIESFAEGVIKIGSLTISNERILTFSIGVTLLLVVLFIVNRTSLGRQMEAIAQNRTGAALNGIRINRVAAIACAIGFGLAAVAGSMMGAYRSLTPTMGDAIILRILMLVMLSGVGSMNGIIITGLVMGALDSWLPFFFQGFGSDAVASIIVVVLLLIRPKGFFGHEDVIGKGGGTSSIHGNSKSHPLIKFLPYMLLVATGAVLPIFINSSFWLFIFVLVFVRCIGAVGLRTISLSGNLSFAQAAFVGVGAYTAAVLGKELGMPVYLTIPAATAFATILGIGTGFPFVRLRATYFSMATLFLGVAIVFFISALPFMGGTNGMKNIPPLFENLNAVTGYYFFFALAVLSCIIMYRFEFSRIGTTLRALAQSPEAASAMGVNEVYFRLLAVGFGCFFAGLAGAAFAHYNTSLSPTSFGMGIGLWYIMYVMIGGKDSFTGPIIGTILLVVIPELSRGLNQYAPYMTAGAMLIVAYFLPGGLASIPGVIRHAVDKNRQKREAASKAEGGV